MTLDWGVIMSSRYALLPTIRASSKISKRAAGIEVKHVEVLVAQHATARESRFYTPDYIRAVGIINFLVRYSFVTFRTCHLEVSFDKSRLRPWQKRRSKNSKLRFSTN